MIISLLLSLLVIAVICWAFTTLFPLPARFQQVIYVLGALIALVLILRFFGLLGGVVLS